MPAKAQEKIVKLFGKQYDAFTFETQFAAAVAGVQSGKTFLGAHWAGKKIQEFPLGTGVIVAPTYKILQQATLKKFFDILPQLRKNYGEQKGEIRLSTGGVVFVRSADSPLGIEGITADWIWLDEGGMTSILTWTVLRSRVSMTGGQILITTTPYNMGWLYQDFFIPWRDKVDKSLSFFTWRSVDNPGFSKDFYDAESRRLPPEEFSRRYMGEFRKMTGLVFDLPESHIIAPIEGLTNKTQDKVIGVDWGFRNPAAVIVAAKLENNWYVVDEWKQANRITAEIIQAITNLAKQYKVYRIYPDPAEPDRIEECKREHLPVYEADKDVQGGLGFIRQLIHEGRLWVYNTCPATIDEFSQYHYAEPVEGKENKEEPEKLNDHLCDALRYALYSYQPVKPFTYTATAPVPYYYPELKI